MTEAEWLACVEPRPMLGRLGRGASERKLRLFACECYRRLWTHRPGRHASWNVLAVSERYADGLATKHELRVARRWAPFPHERMACGVAWEAAEISSRLCLSQFRQHGAVGNLGDLVTGKEDPAEAAAHARVIRDVFGNPFRPATVDPRWLTAAVVGLARTMYEGRDFAAMPILADALEESGCEDAAVLSHCRGDGPHARGCWVVDLILGKG